MKRAILFLFSLALLAPIGVHAATFESSDSFIVGIEEEVLGNHYVAGNRILIEGNVDGDLYAAGLSVSVPGVITDDFTAVAQNITIDGSVEDIRVAGENVRITGTVNGEVVVFGGTVEIATGAVVTGNVHAYAGQLLVDGTIEGDLRGESGLVDLRGNVLGMVDIAAERLSVGSSANIAGNLEYSSPFEAEINEAATVSGETIYNFITFPDEPFAEFDVTAFAVQAAVHIFLLMLVSVLIFALVLQALWHKKMQSVVDEMFNKYGLQLLRGLGAFIVAPIMIFIVLLTGIGSFTAVFAGTIYFGMLVLAKAITGIGFGAWFFWLFAKRKAHREKSRKQIKIEITWGSTIVGVILMAFMGAIPVFGWPIAAAFFFAALGAMLNMLYHSIGKK